MVDPHGSLSRNDTAAADTLGVALQSVLELISAEEQHQEGEGSRLVRIPNV